MPFDFKKEFKEYYMPSKKPAIVTIPEMNFLAVGGKGDPNEEDGEYKNSISLIYTVAYTLRMSYKTDYKIDGYFKYVVPPLEGLWWQNDLKGSFDYSKKEDMEFISLMRLPNFITEDNFKWAVNEATEKKKMDFSKLDFVTYDEGECVQVMHVGAYDDEPATIKLMDNYMEENGYELDISDTRHHHEIYLSDPRRCKESNLKTVIRHPIRKIANDR